ncbi:MAG: VCBS repeat-containing protein [Planctomycetes bacterium]|nr:VCBS repeat-containing protein [Planctomycetota bacterium]MBI3848541.1 VCBS repeat-containing protein [Planctomycetota bacterium]
MQGATSCATRALRSNRTAAGLVIGALLIGCGHQTSLNPSLSLRSVQPNSGPSTGGGTIDVSGRAFDDSIAVTLGGLTAPLDQVLSTTRARVRVPSLVGRIGFLDVQVSKGTQSASLSQGYRVFAASVDFDTFHSYPTNFVPIAGTLFDFDQNGTLDLALATSSIDGSDGAVVLMLATSAGVFGNPIVLVRTPRPVSIAAADLDRDGRPDLVVSDFTANDLLILHNEGNGVFAAPFMLSTALAPTRVVVVDVNGDTVFDLVVSCMDGRAVDVFLGNTAIPGMFPTTPSVVPVSMQATSVAVGDLDGNSIPDLVVSGRMDSQHGAISVFLGDGTGNFLPTSPNPASPTQPVDVAIADIDADTRNDILYLRGSFPLGVDGALGYLHNANAGTFDPPREFVMSRVPFWLSPSDVNGDGRLDVFVTSREDGDLTLYLGNGDPGTVFTDPPTSIEAGADSVFAAAARIDNDQIPDLVSVSESGRDASVLLGVTAAGSFTQPVDLDLGDVASDIISTDTDGDGIPECVVALGATGVALLRRNGAGGFSAPVITAVPGSPTILAPLPSNQVAAVGSTDQLIHRLFPTSSGSLEERPEAPALPGVTAPSAVLVADLDLDGLEDLVAGSGSDGAIRVLRARADGGYDALSTFSAVGSCRGLAAADWNGDGRIDLAVADGANPQLALCFGLGDGTFALPPLAVALDSNATALVPIDADGNTFPDLLIGEAGMSQARTFLATGTGTFAAGAVIALSTDAVQFVVDDWNFDGRDDVLAVQSTGNVVTLYLGQADRSLGAPRSFGVGSNPSAAVAYDLNGSRPTDLVVSSSGRRGLSLLTNLAR